METKGLRRRIQRKLFNVVNVLLDGGGFRLSIYARLRELMANFESLGIKVHFDDSCDETYILVISDSTSIVDLRSQEVQNLIRDFLIFVQKHAKLLLAHHQILIGKLVSDVPADGTKFTTVLHDGVEKTEAEQQFLEFLCFFALVELLFIHVFVCTKQVVSETLGRLQRHLNTVLKDGNGERFSWH